MDTTKLYENYGRVPKELIKKYLSKINLINEEDYEFIIPEKVLDSPRNHSLTYEPKLKSDKYNINILIPIKKMPYLVKSSSRFFLKPDIGEVFDQISDYDLPKIKAIKLHSEYETLDTPEMDEFIMYVTLFVSSREKKLERILKK